MTSLDLHLLHHQVNKALAAAYNGNGQELLLLSSTVLVHLQNDRQAQLVRSAIQNHQTVTFDLALTMAPPVDPWAARQSFSAAIRHGFLYAALPLLPFVQADAIPGLMKEIVITQQQDFFNILYSQSHDEEKLFSLFASSQYKHTHDLGVTYTQWKEHWYAQEQRNAIVSQLRQNGDVPRARKI